MSLGGGWGAWGARVLIGVAVLGAASVGIRERAAVALAFERDYYARQCAEFDGPANVILDEGNAAKAAGLVGAGRDYLLDRQWPGRARAVYRPWCVQRLDQLMRSSGMTGLTMHRSLIEYPTVFLHERVSPAGHRRLVHVELVLRNAMLQEECFAATVITPASLMKGGKVVGSQCGTITRGPYVAARISCGRADPKDSSHFSFDYMLEDPQDENAVKYQVAARGIVDGYLEDDEQVRFSVRK